MANALVLSGGGAKGAFSVGAVMYMINNNKVSQFDVISGTSTGALMAPLIALGELDYLKRIYTTTRTTDIITKFNIGEHNILNGENHFFGTDPHSQHISKPCR